MTTNTGAPVWNNNASLTAGERGPILLEDYHLVEKLANFDRERIPERVVHARGASAKGFFEVSCLPLMIYPSSLLRLAPVTANAAKAIRWKSGPGHDFLVACDKA
jgi:hypothetical protein